MEKIIYGASSAFPYKRNRKKEPEPIIEVVPAVIEPETAVEEIPESIADDERMHLDDDGSPPSEIELEKTVEETVVTEKAKQTNEEVVENWKAKRERKKKKDEVSSELKEKENADDSIKR